MKRLFGLAVICLLPFVVGQRAQTLTGKVIGVYDGDTITVLLGKTQHKIRLEGIDAPESGQAFGKRAKQALAGLVFGKTVKVTWQSRDRYKRVLGDVYVDGTWVNRALVAEGLAWHFVKYSNDKRLADAQVAAKRAKRGLWADGKPIAPWDFRKGVGLNRNRLFVTRTGKSYHCEGCKYLKSKIPITLEEAKKRGYKACRFCKPPSQ